MKKIKNFIQTLIYKNIYGIKPDKNIWIFSSIDNERYNYNSKYLFQYILKNENNITPYFVINNNKLRMKLQHEYGENFFIETNSKSGIKKVLSGGVWFTSAGLPLYGTNLNKKRIIVNLWHGIPLKKIALMENNFSFIKKLYFKNIFSKNYSYILTTSKKLTLIMKESFGVDEEVVKVWGQPRNDCLFKKVDYNNLKNIIPDLPSYKKLILYAPTYRAGVETKIFPFRDYNKDKLEYFLDENKAIIFIRTHISESIDVKKYLGKRIILLNENIIEDIMVVLNLFDVLITDYSSIYIDFLLLQRPIIFLPYDKDKYLHDRGFNFDYDNVTPGYKPNDMKSFIKDVEEIFKGNDLYKEEREEVNNFFNEIKSECCRNICLNIKKIINRNKMGE